jgi:CheY-like chemotaxis protein
VSEKHSRLSAFEARLAQLGRNVSAGLGDRAARIEAHAKSLVGDPATAREGLRQEAHKLRGVAGTFGHAALGELAATLEQLAHAASTEQLVELATQLVERVRAAGITVLDGACLPQPATPPPAVAPRPNALRVLAIDDDNETLRLLELTLRNLGGFTTVVATHGQEALNRLAAEPFDLVLCDAMMPDMNGLAFCERSQKLTGRHALPPIVILSAATPAELGWPLQVGTIHAAWWRKPFRPKELLAQIHSRSEERRVGKECRRLCRSRWSPYH